MAESPTCEILVKFRGDIALLLSLGSVRRLRGRVGLGGVQPWPAREG
jgi:hypothetical protein